MSGSGPAGLPAAVSSADRPARGRLRAVRDAPGSRGLPPGARRIPRGERVLRVSRGGMPVRNWLGLSVALMAAVFAGCGSECPLIHQSFVVVAPDSALQTLV